MSKYVNSEELKRRIRADVEQEGSTLFHNIGEWICALIDEMPAVEIGKDEEGGGE